MEASEQHAQEQEQRDRAAAEHAPESQPDESVIVGDDGMQGLADAQMHDPNKVGPSSAPPASNLSGEPLDPATREALSESAAADGEPEVSGAPGGEQPE